MLMDDKDGYRETERELGKSLLAVGFDDDDDEDFNSSSSLFFFILQNIFKQLGIICVAFISEWNYGII